MPTISIQDAEFYYEIHGAGQPIILISGYTCDHRYWIPVLEPLRKNFQVLIFDNRGVGQTKDDGRNLSVSLMAEDMLALSKALNLNKPHIIGQSMGGTIAQYIAAYYPEEINKLVLLTTTAKRRSAMLLAFETSLKLRAQNVDFDLLFNTSLSWIFGEKFLQNKKKIEVLKNILLTNPYPQSLENQYRQFEVLKNFDGLADLSKIKAPCLVVYGEEDIVTLPQESKLLYDLIPNAELVGYPTGHGMIAEMDPIQGFVNDLFAFLD